MALPLQGSPLKPQSHETHFAPSLTWVPRTQHGLQPQREWSWRAVTLPEPPLDLEGVQGLQEAGWGHLTAEWAWGTDSVPTGPESIPYFNKNKGCTGLHGPAPTSSSPPRSTLSPATHAFHDTLIVLSVSGKRLPREPSRWLVCYFSLQRGYPGLAVSTCSPVPGLAVSRQNPASVSQLLRGARKTLLSEAVVLLTSWVSHAFRTSLLV